MAKQSGIATFRAKLLVAMMLVVIALTALGLFLAERKVAIEAERDLQQDFRNELATLHGVQEMRHAALAERCRALVQRPRIHAALEDNALDLLYPSAKDEMRDVLGAWSPETPTHALNARFYRFLDSRGAVISPPAGAEVGELLPEEEAQLALPSMPNGQQLGYIARRGEGGTESVDEVFAMPIVSTETGDVIAALVIGFKSVELGSRRARTEIKSGIWLNGKLHSPALAGEERAALSAEMPRIAGRAKASFPVQIGGVPHLVFNKHLNPGSLFPPAYEVAVYPLRQAIARRRQIRSHVLMAGGALLVFGLIASHFLARRLAAPVEDLAAASERTEAALETTSEELQRSARFSADASHQLKTPITVLRAGLDRLLAHDDLPPEIYHELSALLHQTYRITSVIDDLLLLSRMDAGSLRIQFGSVPLSELLEEWLDDFTAVPDDLEVKVETDFGPDLRVEGERRYITLIVQNLLENARKYNRAGGWICVAAREDGEFVVFTVGNTGRPIPPANQGHIFERFHRGAIGENIPGHGLGLNLARELARLHGGDLRLTKSEEDWTEFEVRFRVARQAAGEAAAA